MPGRGRRSVSRASKERKSSPPSLPSTPANPSESRKRDLTSPLEEQEIKKQLLSSPISGSINPELPSSPTSQMPVSPANVSMESEESRGNGAPAKPDTTKNITLNAGDLEHIAELLKGTFQPMLETNAKTIIDGVISGLEARIVHLEKQNADLKGENEALKKKIELLEMRCDDNEQYSRRNSVRITGLPDSGVGEDTDDIIIEMCSKLKVQISKADIDRSHRVGKVDTARSGSPRSIIVKFATYRARASFYKARVKLRSVGYNRVFVNEDLTKRRSTMLYLARTLVKSEKLAGAWSTDGRVLVKDKSNRIHKIDHREDLAAFE